MAFRKINQACQRTALKLKSKRTKSFYRKFFMRIINGAGCKAEPVKDDLYKAWINKWSCFGLVPSNEEYSAYMHFNSDIMNVIPNEVSRSFMEPILSPSQFQPFYGDKNSFNLFIDKDMMPRTLFRSMHHHIYDCDYSLISEDKVAEIISEVDRFVVKPTRNMGGRGIALFVVRDGHFEDSEGNVFSVSKLESMYGTNYIVQECIVQSDFMAQFNQSSINTLRLATYRDVGTGDISVIGAVMRMGNCGSFVDNASSGGVFIAIGADGRLGKHAMNEAGKTFKSHNGIDFDRNELVVPDFDRVKAFVIEIAKRFPHMCLLAHDVAILKDGKPVLIEVNSRKFSSWLFQLTDQTLFGDGQQALVEHCLKRQGKIRIKAHEVYND